jgi:peroxisomal coenzyme A diphosphatase NUDT7
MTSLKQLRKSLPKQRGIQFREEYIDTAVMVLLILINGEYHFVFQKRGANIRQKGEIGFPGGVCQPGDGGPERTAVRETVEEMGIPEDKIRVIGSLGTFIAPMGAIVDAFVGLADISNIDELHPNSKEVEEIFTVPVSFFENNDPQEYSAILKVHPAVTDERTGKEVVLLPSRDLGLPEIYEKPWGGMKHAIYLYKVENRIVWGLTARIVLDLIRRLRA